MSNQTAGLVEALSLRLGMDHDRNIAALERQLNIVKSESLDQRFRRIGIEWVPGMTEFQRAASAAAVAHQRLNECGGRLFIHPAEVTRLELRNGEELGKPDTVRISVSQPYPYPSFECYLPLDWFMEEWLKIGGVL